MISKIPAPLPLRPAAARLRQAHAPKASVWPTAPAPETVPLGTHPAPATVRTAREYWGFTQEEAAAKVFAAQRTWQKWEAANGAAMPLAAWALFNRVAPERDATHFQFVIAGGDRLVITVGSYVLLQPRRGPRLIAQLRAVDDDSRDNLTQGMPQGRARGVVVGFPDLDDAELIGCPYRRGELVRFSLQNILTAMHQLPDAHRYAVSVDDPAVLEVLERTAERLRQGGVVSKLNLTRNGQTLSAVLTATSIAQSSAVAAP